MIARRRYPRDYAVAVDAGLQFEAMVRDTPTLQAHHCDILRRMADAARDVVAARAGLDRHDPEPQIAATALLGLWSVQVDSSCRHLGRHADPTEVRRAVTDEVRRAAGLLEAGLATFATAS
jgi:hypothetical protein